MCSLNIVVTWFNADAWDASLTSMGRAIFIIDLRSFRFANSKFSNISTTIATATKCQLKYQNGMFRTHLLHIHKSLSLIIIVIIWKICAFFVVCAVVVFVLCDSHSFISIRIAGGFFCCTSKQIILCKTLFVTLVLTITHKYNWKCAREQNIANMKWTKKHTHTLANLLGVNYV